VDAKKAKNGDFVTAKTLQVIKLPDGETIAKGTVIVGHVVAAEPLHVDRTPYAHQKPSFISIHFDKVQRSEGAIPVKLYLRAIAGTLDSLDAAAPHYLDETDRSGTVTLIGGTEFAPFDKVIHSVDGDAIGYNRKDGVFAKLTSAGYSAMGMSFHCESTDQEQSVAIFSPGACGVYGLGGAYLPESGQDGSGTFTLAARGRSIKVYAGSTALLQVHDAE
jgi:hypothetical protein